MLICFVNIAKDLFLYYYMVKDMENREKLITKLGRKCSQITYIGVCTLGSSITVYDESTGL